MPQREDEPRLGRQRRRHPLDGLEQVLPSVGPGRDGFAFEGQHGSASLVAADVVDDAAACDRQQVGAEARGVAQPPQRAEGGHESVLRQVLRVVGVADGRPYQPEDRPGVAVHELGEPFGTALLDCLDQGRAGGEAHTLSIIEKR